MIHFFSMKKFVISILAALMCVFQAQAQKKTAFHMGIEGGVTMKNLRSAQESLKNLPGCHAGVIFSLKLPAHFSLQPAVQYEWGRSQAFYSAAEQQPQKGTLTTHNLVVPVAVQWGPDLGVIRPFVQVVPYWNLNFGGSMKLDNGLQQVGEYLKKSQFGIGLGGGLEVWRVQISARYNWSFGDWRTMVSTNPLSNMDKRYGGVTVTASIFLF